MQQIRPPTEDNPFKSKNNPLDKSKKPLDYKSQYSINRPSNIPNGEITTKEQAAAALRQIVENARNPHHDPTIEDSIHEKLFTWGNTAKGNNENSFLTAKKKDNTLLTLKEQDYVGDILPLISKYNTLCTRFRGGYEEQCKKIEEDLQKLIDKCQQHGITIFRGSPKQGIIGINQKILSKNKTSLLKEIHVSNSRKKSTKKTSLLKEIHVSNSHKKSTKKPSRSKEIHMSNSPKKSTKKKHRNIQKVLLTNSQEIPKKNSSLTRKKRQVNNSI